VNGECRAEQEPETEDGLEPPAWPYGWLDWAGIIAALVGVGLLAAGLSLGGLALLVISVIALIVGFIKGQREAEEWARKQAIKNKKKEIKRTIDSLRNAGYDSLSDFQGTGIVPENDDLRKMGFTDEDIQELEDYARGTQ